MAADYRQGEWTLLEERIKRIIDAAIADGSLSLRELERQTAVSRQTIALFLARKRGLNTWSAGKILRALDHDFLIQTPPECKAPPTVPFASPFGSQIPKKRRQAADDKKAKSQR